MDKPKMSSPSKGATIFAHIFLVYAQLAAILMYTLGKNVMSQGVSFSAFIAIRLGICVPFLLAASFYLTRQWRPPKEHIWWMIVLGFFTIVVQQAMLAFGLTLTTSTNASIITAPCTPLFTSALSIVRGIDKITWSKGAGFLCAVTGALILLEIWNFSFEGKTLGNLIIMGTSVSSAFNTLLLRRFLDAGVHPITAIAYPYFFGLVMFVAVYSHFGLFSAASWQFTQSTALQSVLVGTVGTLIPWIFGSYALKNTSPMTCSIYVVLQPPLSATLGLILGEKFSLHQGLGCVLVLLGLVFVNANEQARDALIGLYYRALGKSRPSHKNFQLLQSEENEDVSDEKQFVEMKGLKTVPDGASMVTEDEDGTVFTFNNKPTNDIVIGVEPPAEYNKDAL